MVAEAPELPEKQGHPMGKLLCLASAKGVELQFFVEKNAEGQHVDDCKKKGETWVFDTVEQFCRCMSRSRIYRVQSSSKTETLSTCKG